MKTILSTISLIILLTLNLITKAQSHEQGNININLGIGFGNFITGNGHTRATPPVSISGEYGITDDISLGVLLGYTGARYEYSGFENCTYNYLGSYNTYAYIDTYKWSYILSGLRGAYHFGKLIEIDELDAYAGLMLGYDFASYRYSTTSICPGHVRYSSPNYGGFIPAIYGGARYRFTENMGIFAELGYGISFLNMGVNFKL